MRYPLVDRKCKTIPPVFLDFCKLFKMKGANQSGTILVGVTE